MYGDIASHGTRAVMTLLSIGNISYEFIPVDLNTFATQTPEYLKINPFGMIPFFIDGTFEIPESSSILIYLC